MGTAREVLSGSVRARHPIAGASTAAGDRSHPPVRRPSDFCRVSEGSAPGVIPSGLPFFAEGVAKALNVSGIHADLAQSRGRMEGHLGGIVPLGINGTITPNWCVVCEVTREAFTNR